MTYAIGVSFVQLVGLKALASAPLLGHGSVAERGVPHLLSCQQGVSNRTVRAHTEQDGKALGLPADLVRRGVGGGPMMSCSPV
jgi:hypothetical protein